MIENTENEKRLGNKIAEMAICKGKSFTSVELRVWTKRLKRFDINKVCNALDLMCEDTSPFPILGQVIENLGKINVGSKNGAEDYWNDIIIKSFSNGKLLPSKDEVGNHTVKSMGGYSYFGKCNQDSLPFIKKEFIEMYNHSLQFFTITGKLQIAGTETKKIEGSTGDLIEKARDNLK
jgi:hypothetical protein